MGAEHALLRHGHDHPQGTPRSLHGTRPGPSIQHSDCIHWHGAQAASLPALSYANGSCSAFLRLQGTLFPMCGMNLAFDRDLIGAAMYFGLMGHGQPLGRYDDMWAGWCCKVSRAAHAWLPASKQCCSCPCTTAPLWQRLQLSTAAPLLAGLHPCSRQGYAPCWLLCMLS